MATAIAAFGQMASFSTQGILSTCGQFLKPSVGSGPTLFPEDITNIGPPVFLLDAGAYGQAKRGGVGGCNPDGCGEDSFFVSRHKSGLSSYIGIADGVGGWNAMGVDPSFMSRQMMANAHALARQATDDDIHLSPREILSRAYWKIIHGREVDAGSTTTCVISVSHNPDGSAPVLHSANLGDSGFMVIRNNEVVIFSEFQRQDNAPRQLAMVPERFQHIGAIQSNPDEADILTVQLQEGDIVICATDGLWDNIPRESSWEGLPVTVHQWLQQGASMQDIARSLVEMAVRTNFKPDDVTVVCARIVRNVAPVDTPTFH